MNEMTKISPIQRFSAGEISRRQLAHLLGAPVSFGEALMMLHAHNLPLPRYGRPFNPAGIEKLREVLRLVKHRDNTLAAYSAIQALIQTQDAKRKAKP